MGAEIDRLEIQIETQATKANAQLDKLAAKLGKISASLNGINTSKLNALGNSMKATTEKSTSTNSALKRLSDSMNNLTSMSNRADKSTRSLAASFGMFYASMFPIIRGIKALGRSIEKSMDYIETYNYFNVTMDKIAKENKSMYSKMGYDSADSYADSFKSRLNGLTEKMSGYKVGSDGMLDMSGIKNLNLDPEQIMSYQANIAAVTNSVGLVGETSVNASKALSMLAADMSSLKNIDMQTVMTNFQSGLIGQSRALYKYGIDITNATLQTYAYKHGINMAVQEMTQADKMQLRLLAILDQSKVAWGDMGNTISSVANQYRIMKQQMSNVARTIGAILMPVMKAILPVINGLLISIQRLLSWFGVTFIKDWGKIMDGISGGYSGDDFGIDDSDIEDAAGSAGDLGNNLGSAADKAKKLQRTLLGFDQINKLNDNTDTSSSLGSGSGSGGAGGGIDLSGDIAAALAEYEAVWDKALANSQNKAQEWADKIAATTLNMWAAIEPFRQSIVRLWDEGLSKFGNFTWTALKDFYNEFLVPIGVWSFGTKGAGLTRLVDVINNGLMAIHWDELNKSLKEFWKAIEPYAVQFGEGLIDFFEDVVGVGVDVINGIPGLLDKLTGALNRGDHERARKWGYALGQLAVAFLAFKGVAAIVGGIAKIGTAFKGLSEGLGALFGEAGLFTKIGQKLSILKGGFASLFVDDGIFASMSLGTFGAIAAGIAILVAGIIDLWKTSETFRDNVKNMWSIIGGAFLEAKQKIWDEGLKPLWESIKELFGSLYEIYESSGLKEIFEAIVTGIGYIATGALGILILAIGEFVKFLASAIKGAVDILGKMLDYVKNFINEHKEIFDGLKRIFGGVTEFLAGVFSGDWRRAWNGIKDIFAGIWDTFVGIVKSPVNKILSIIESMINGIISAFNSLKRMLNTLKIDVPDWVPKIGGEKLGFNFGLTSNVSLPRLAKGGVLNTGQAFIAREKGAELVGQWGNKTSVINNDQLLDAAGDSLKNAFAEVAADVLMLSNGGNQGNTQINVVLEGDAQQVFRVVKVEAAKYERETMQPAF